MTQISAKVIADSKANNSRLATKVVTFPRFILAELNTHRMFTRNSASSRAIPFKKMIRSVKENPFIPIAWQKDHSGMQGTEYFSKTETFDIKDFITALGNLFDHDEELIKSFQETLKGWEGQSKTLDEWWLTARDLVLQAAVMLSCFGVTKQLCNRLLEPFMWHTVIVSATEWENFFALRCPRYNFNGDIYRSKKDVLKHYPSPGLENDLLYWLSVNEGQAEIHMMALAEAMWDAYNESTPKELQPGEWHIPFGDDFNHDVLKDTIAKRKGIDPVFVGEGTPAWEINKVKVAVARCARVSYTVVGEEGKEPNYENDIKLHDRLAASGHWSPFEHCAKAMTHQEFYENVCGKIATVVDSGSSAEWKNPLEGNASKSFGWSGNFKGFIQYRKTFNNENITK